MISAAERAWPGAGLSRWVSAGIVALLLGLVPWTAFLAVTLHGRFEARHWDIAWVGFDAVLIVVFAYTAWAAWFRRQILVAAALVAATLLVCDAWFDVTMSLGTPDQTVTIATALLVELPLAGFLFWCAHRIMVRTVAAFRSLLGDDRVTGRLSQAPLLFVTGRGAADSERNRETTRRPSSRNDPR